VTGLGVVWDELSSAAGVEVVVPGSAVYDTVRKPAMARFNDVRPVAVVRCESPAGVAAAVRFARRAGLPVGIRCGGHSVAGHSSTGGVLLDVTPMRHVSVDDGVATVGAGVRLGALYAALHEHGVTIPAGCGPSVGVGGLTLGGGIGVLGRRYGLTCDRLLRAEVALADGRVIECDEKRDPDLFWALRGAGGGNLGVVTSFVFRTVPAPVTTVFHLLWPLADAAGLVERWQEWAPDVSDDVDATLRLSGGGYGEPRAELFGAVLADEPTAVERLEGFVSQAGLKPAAASSSQLAYPLAKRRLNEVDQHGDASAHEPGPIYAKSEFFRRSLDRQTIGALVEGLAQQTPGARVREVAFMPWGGAYNRVASDAVAFPHRDERFLVQHLLETPPDLSETEAETARGWLQRSWALLHPSGSGGVYPNFPDPDLPDWGHAYYRENYERLVEIKSTYDPDDVFRFHQSLPTTRSGGSQPR
jgi:FAD/FMN-containing dehydrogenase